MAESPQVVTSDHIYGVPIKSKFCILCGKDSPKKLKSVTRNMHEPIFKTAIDVFGLQNFFAVDDPPVYICSSCFITCSRILQLRASAETHKEAWEVSRNHRHLAEFGIKVYRSTPGVSNDIYGSRGALNKPVIVRHNDQMEDAQGHELQYALIQSRSRRQQGPSKQKGVGNVEIPSKSSLGNDGINDQNVSQNEDHTYSTLPLSDLIQQHRYFSLMPDISGDCADSDKIKFIAAMKKSKTWTSMIRALMSHTLFRKAVEAFLVTELDCGLERLSSTLYPSVLRSKSSQMSLDTALAKLLKDLQNEVPFLITFMIGLCCPVHKKIEGESRITVGLLCSMGLFNRNFQLGVVQRIITTKCGQLQAGNELISFLHKLRLTLATKHKYMSVEDREHASMKKRKKSQTAPSKKKKMKMSKENERIEEEIKVPQTVVMDTGQYWTSGNLVETDAAIVALQTKMNGQTVVEFKLAESAKCEQQTDTEEEEEDEDIVRLDESPV